MKNQFFLLFKLSVCLFIFSCEKKIPATPKDLLKENLIPQPVSLLATGSSFRVTKKTKIILGNTSKELEGVGAYFAKLIRPATGFDFPIEKNNKTSTSGNIIFLIDEKKEDMGEEGYHLEITEEKIVLKAPSPKGIFRGVQTIRQLFSEKIESKTIQKDTWEIASGIISDFPNYEYRGAMLDVSRHFFKVDEVKKYIDWCARFKMNVVHLHLSDDQGWRIEIKKWPNLTKIGGSTEVGGGEGGFFTQEDYKEIIRYAEERFITIVPEIDMPGHTNAALASYAKLNCDGKARKLYTGMRVGFSSLCTSEEIVYQFIDDVVGEIAALTPGPYFHIGGDESDATKKKDYIKFVNRVQGIVKKHGKQMMGWDDITAANLNSNSVAQHWSKEAHAKTAVKQGLKIVMSPAKKAYLDMQYDSTTQLGLHWAAYIEIDDGYNWNPATLISGVAKENILGIECPLWTETVTNMDEMAYLVFPRLLGYAEIGWTQDSLRNWESYSIRLGNQAERLKAMELNYYKSKKVNWVKTEIIEHPENIIE